MSEVYQLKRMAFRKRNEERKASRRDVQLQQVHSDDDRSRFPHLRGPDGRVDQARVPGRFDRLEYVSGCYLDTYAERQEARRALGAAA